MNLFTQTVLLIGRITPDHVELLGTGFLISKDGKVVTTKHVVGNSDAGLCVLLPHITDINSYQDTTDSSVKPVNAKVIEADPLKDIVILDTGLNFQGNLPEIGSFDECAIGETLGIYGFPHAGEGRRVLTYHETKVGAKVLLESQGLKSKYAILNTQTRPGQSGSLIFSPKNNKIVGLLIGAYSQAGRGGISLGGINPAELHQTTHCISAEYIKEMI
jgi:S1-C subfamily serine protease